MERDSLPTQQRKEGGGQGKGQTSRTEGIQKNATNRQHLGNRGKGRSKDSIGSLANKGTWGRETPTRTNKNTGGVQRKVMVWLFQGRSTIKHHACGYGKKKERDTRHKYKKAEKRGEKQKGKEKKKYGANRKASKETG